MIEITLEDNIEKKDVLERYDAHPFAALLAMREAEPGNEIALLEQLSKDHRRFGLDPNGMLEKKASLLRMIKQRHYDDANEILEYYACLYAERRILGTDLSTYKKRVCRIQSRFASGDFTASTNDLKVIWKLPFFYNEDMILDKASKKYKPAKHGGLYPDDVTELTLIEKYTKVNKRVPGEVYLFSCSINEVYHLKIDPHNNLQPLLINYLDTHNNQMKISGPACRKMQFWNQGNLLAWDLTKSDYRIIEDN